MDRPLTGIRVLDLSTVVAGPSATQLLGDLGAEVIKVEPPGGEFMRRTMAGPHHEGQNYLYLAYNRNKKSICLDLRTPAGREALHDLVRVSDVVYDSFRPDIMARLGADYETLRTINPRIICFSSTGYGSTGPDRDRPGYDVMAQAEGGILSVTGYPAGEPVRCGISVVDINTGVFGALSVVTALLNRERTGRGMRVETSLLNVAVYLMAYHIVYYLVGGAEAPRTGNGHLTNVPQGAYRCRDGNYITIGAVWPRIARVIGEEWIADDPRFKEPNARAAHREELDRVLNESFQKMDSEDWLDIFRMEDMPCARVNSVAQVVEHPQVLDQNMILQLAHQLGGHVGLVDNPIRIDGVRLSDDYSAPPLAGEHTTDILKGLLGYSEQKLCELSRQQEENAEETKRHTVKQR